MSQHSFGDEAYVSLHRWLKSSLPYSCGGFLVVCTTQPRRAETVAMGTERRKGAAPDCPQAGRNPSRASPTHLHILARLFLLIIKCRTTAFLSSLGLPASSGRKYDRHVLSFPTSAPDGDAIA